jgi:SAM-dependent methyltransferase
VSAPGIRETAARGFSRAPDDYERGRPSYPPQAVERLLAEVGATDPATHLLELGAGTGKLTALLVAAGLRPLAVEPVDAMRAKLAASAPGAEPLRGTAEEIPLGDGAVDAVVVAQAFHWFRPEPALAEIHRVLRPAGRLGLIWNRRSGWPPGIDELLAGLRGSAPHYGRERGAWREAFASTALFSPLAEASYEHSQLLDVEGVVARVASTSFVAALPDERLAEVRLQVAQILASDPATRGRERFELRYETDVYWCERLEGA